MECVSVGSTVIITLTGMWVMARDLQRNGAQSDDHRPIDPAFWPLDGKENGPSGVGGSWDCGWVGLDITDFG